MQITGPPRDKDKIVAIKALNRLLKQSEFSSKARNISYDDVTAFLEIYTLKGSLKPSMFRLAALSSKDAYKNAIYDYFLGKERPQPSYEILVAQKPVIANERDLAKVVTEVIVNVIKHHIEDRH
jgi:hypothetical protein